MSETSYQSLLDDACKAAKLASSDDNLDEALYSHVESMELEPGVSRNAVYELAKECLGL